MSGMTTIPTVSFEWPAREDVEAARDGVRAKLVRDFMSALFSDSLSAMQAVMQDAQQYDEHNPGSDPVTDELLAIARDHALGGVR
ncbi:hypothetical protein ACFY97_18710 [Streptomyces klenkii]|uniref:hypothetical protein n=1 Tax=Streptomyces klenkii TaxID=1420899 RepID=UPI0036EF8311